MKQTLIIFFCLVCLALQSIYAQEAKFLTEKYELFDSNRQRSIPIQIYKPTSEEIRNLPTVIINHGYSVENTEYTFIAEPLCIKGYFVISIQHDLPGDHVEY